MAKHPGTFLLTVLIADSSDNPRIFHQTYAKHELELQSFYIQTSLQLNTLQLHKDANLEQKKRDDFPRTFWFRRKSIHQVFEPRLEW